MSDEAWRDAALCAQTDPELFFPEKGGATAAAKAVCSACDVQEQCLEFALTEGIRDGVWGGLTYRQRVRVAAARAAGLQPCGTPAAHRRHLRRGEVPDEACMAAMRAAEAERRERARARAREAVAS